MQQVQKVKEDAKELEMQDVKLNLDLKGVRNKNDYLRQAKHKA